MKSKSVLILLAGILIISIAFINVKNKNSVTSKIITEELKPFKGNIEEVISTTGIIKPKNRLEIMPPISGRIEEILVKEGSPVKTGQILALMSSTDRAALLDAAIPQGTEKVKYWQEVYKATPLISPINGKVIVRSVEPGQTVNSNTVVLVLSDTLIIKGQVDETDIGQVHTGQGVTITLDAYPAIKTSGKVGHISYESTVVNNVTIYEVDIIPNQVPAIYRSGMSANLDIIKNSKKNILLLNAEAIQYQGQQAFVFVKDNSAEGYHQQEITTGLSQNGLIEIVSGLTEEQTVVIVEEVSGKKKAQAKSFMPTPGSRRR